MPAADFLPQITQINTDCFPADSAENADHICEICEICGNPFFAAGEPSVPICVICGPPFAAGKNNL